MTVNVEELTKAFPELALAIITISVLGWAFLVQRKGKDSDGREIKRSSLLVPGWKHDDDLDEAHSETERVRKFYEAALKDAQKQAEIRVGEVRGYRDEAIATNATLLETLTSATRDVALILQLLRSDDADRRDG